MRGRLVGLALICAAGLQGQYAYDGQLAGTWNGTAYTASVSGAWPPVSYTSFTGSGGGSVIDTATVSGSNPNDYEVKSTLYVTGPGTLVHFLRANSTSVQPGSGSYISAEIAVPLGAASYTAATLNVNQCVNGTVTQLGSTSITVFSGMTFRTVIFGTNLWIYDGTNTLIMTQTVPLTTGSPGIGGYEQVTGWAFGGGFLSTLIGHHDTIAPNQIPATSVATSIFPTAASLKWGSVSDDANGVGVYGSYVTRSGQQPAFVPTLEFTDPTVQPSTSYTYTIQAVDYHGNTGTGTSVTITTPPAQSIDPRRVGVSKLGSYWGGGGEQIDTLSGNLNFSLPVVTAQGRAGWKVPVGLSYNSQNWRNDNGINWQLGGDVGFGYGWTMQIGSITPYYANWLNGPDHFVYTDGSGAQYTLNVNNGGVWSSTQSVYLWYDSNAQILHFKDGTFWVMGCTSAGSEADAGTMYPTVIEDTTGNQVIVTYDTGLGLPYATQWVNGVGYRVVVSTPNTSARILQIQDVTVMQASGSAFSFTYDRTDYAVPHLTSVTGPVGTFNFTYAASTVGPPFGSDPTFANLSTEQLSSLAVPAGLTYHFAYDSAGASELLQVTMPWGGHLRWTYANDAYSGSRDLRAVSGRYLAADSAGATEYSYGLSRDNASGSTIHQTFTLTDASGNGAKTWNFNAPNATYPRLTGLVSDFYQLASAGGTVYTHDHYTWGLDGGSNPYITQKTSATDPNGSNPQSALSTQTMDSYGYGNVTQSVIYPYNNTTTPLETYNSTFVTASGLVSNYVRNLLSTTTLTTSAGTKTLVTNTYGLPTVNGPLPQYEMDSAPPVAAASRGYLLQSVTPAKTTTYTYSNAGFLSATASDGSAVSQSLTSATNYAAPSSITTQTYGESVTYNSWLGVTSTTGLNGEQLATTYDFYGRPATSTSPYGATWTYSYSTSLPVTQTKSGPDGVTTTTLDGLGRTIRVQHGTGVTDTVYSPCACSPMLKIQKVSAPYQAGGSASGRFTVMTGSGGRCRPRCRMRRARRRIRTRGI